MLTQESTKNGIPATDVPRVSQETTMIQKLLAEHKDLANTLEQRLHAVLRPSAPAAESGGEKQQSMVAAPLVSDLAAFRVQLADLANHYLDILNRLDV